MSLACGNYSTFVDIFIAYIYNYPTTWSHDYVAAHQRFLPHFPLSDLIVCNFVVSDWNVLPGYLIRSFSLVICIWDVACKTCDFITAWSLHILDFFLPAFSNTAPLFLTQPSYHLACADNAIQCPQFGLCHLNI